jgi:hypothetical protein
MTAKQNAVTSRQEPLSEPYPPADHAGKDAAPEHPIPMRSRQANQDLVDLSDHYTASLEDDWLGKPGANLTPLPKGVQVFAGAAFDVRGLIQLAGAPVVDQVLDAPQAVKGIAIHAQGRRFHFLHGAVGSTQGDTKIGEYLLHYADGRTQSVPVVYQRNVSDWQVRAGDPLPTDAVVAWTGETDAEQGAGSQVRLYTYTANNPFPEVRIETVDFISAMAPSAPFLVALTLEPNAPVYEEFSVPRIDDFCPIQPRDPRTSPDLVDLSEHYNASLDDNWFHHACHDLRDLPRGVQHLGGVAFDVRGLVQLAASKSLEVTGVVFPEAVNGIEVHHTGARIHFLQACFWNTVEGAKLGDYVIRYADGQTRAAPIVYGQNILDWWVAPEGGKLTEAETVWRGSNPATASMGLTTHLIKYTWENPLPDVEIATVDFVSDLIEAGPFLVAMTVEPVPPEGS